MAELMLKVKRDALPDPAFQDGDIMYAPNNRRIKHVHAQHICHVDKMGFNGDGLRPNGCLLEFYQAQTSKYKFERVSKTEVKRTVLATQDYEILGATPNAKGEYIDVPLFIARKLQHERHKIFGSTGNEYWYGGSLSPSTTALANVWAEIETKTTHKEADHQRWPFSELELRTYLCISVDDFTDAERAILEEPVTEMEQRVDPKTEEQIEIPVVICQRRRKVDWVNALSLDQNQKTQIANINRRVDIRAFATFVRNQIVEAKT